MIQRDSSGSPWTLGCSGSENAMMDGIFTMTAEALTSQGPRPRVKPTHKPASVGRQKVPVGMQTCQAPSTKFNAGPRGMLGVSVRGARGPTQDDPRGLSLSISLSLSLIRQLTE